MPKSRKILTVTVGFAVLMIAAGCFYYAGFRQSQTAHAASVPDLLSALPAGAPTLVYVDLAAVRASSFYQHRADKGPITVPDRNYAEFVRSTGFDFEKDLDRVVVGLWPETPATGSTGSASPSKEPKKIVVIADGRFDRAKIRDYTTKKGKVDHEDGHEVFRFPADDQAHWNSLAFLDDHRVIMVEGSTIGPMLSAHATNGAKDPATNSTDDPARVRAARVDGAAAFIISHVPPVPQNFSQGGAQSAQLATLARSVQWITIAALPDGDNLRVSLEGECATSADAHQLQSALEILRLFGRAALESPKTSQSMDPATLAVLESLLKTAEVTSTAERVSIRVELTPDVLKLKGPQKAQ